MEVFSINESPRIENSVVTIGIFDGVHKGHKFILSNLIRRAREIGGSSVVITLWPHPRIVLNKDVWNFRLLHSQEEKFHHLEKIGVDYCIIIPFTLELASKSACDFLQEFLVGKIKAKSLLLGYDNAFGKDRKGNPEDLAECASRHGLIVEKVDELRETESNVSSTAIRNALLEGDLSRAKEMLDYDYYIEGRVTTGNKLGRKLGYPTANINPQSAYKLIPKDGVYAVHVEFENVFYEAMLNIGVRPTIDSANPVKIIEAHLFDVDIDLYDREIVIHLRKRMRNEIKFPTLDALKEQLQKDEEEIKKFLSSNY